MRLIQKKPKFTLSLIIVLFIVILATLFIFLSNLLREKQTDILSLKRDVAVTEINQQFIEIESILNSLSSFIEENDDEQVLLNVMTDIDNQSDIITQIYYGKPDKSYIITADFNEPDGFDITQRTWYITALEKQEMAYTVAYIDAIINSPIMSIVLPVYENDVLLGVLGIDIKVDSMTAVINNVVDDQIGYAFVLDSRGYILAHSDLDGQPDQLILYDEFDLPYNLIQDDIGITDTVETLDLQGKIAYETLGDSDYIFGIFMTNSNLNQSVMTLTYIGLSVLALILAGTIVLIYVYNKKIYQPLHKLIEDIKEIDISKETDYRLNVDDKAGFRQARIALNNLIETSMGYQTQLKQSLEDSSYQNQKFKFLLASSPDLVFVLDKNKVYREIYGDTYSVLNLHRRDFIGKSHAQIFGKRYAVERNKQYNRALNGETVLYSWNSHILGQTFYFETMINPIYNQNKEITGIVGVSRDITEQENRYKEMLYISTHDYLTGLYNRKTYDEKLSDMREQGFFPFALVNMDLNGLKLINDAYGHHDGDIAIKRTAEILKDTARNVDFVSRVGGDEFTIIIPNATEKDANDFKRHLKLNFKNEKIHHMDLSVAVGFYIVKDANLTIDEIKKLAENDMYKEKVLEKKHHKNNAVTAILKSLNEKSKAEKKHCDDVIKYSVAIGQALKLNKKEIQLLKKAAKFHDIGKIGLPDEITFKNGSLNEDEYNIVKTHTSVGYDLLKSADEYSMIAEHASSHHEWFDGSGYPNGLEGDQIPMFSRIIAIADAYEAMTNGRTYRSKISKKKAIHELLDYSGSQFDPTIIKTFIEKVLNKEEA